VSSSDRWWSRQVAEEITPHERHVHEVRRVVRSGRTGVQSYEVVELGGYGLALLLDGRIQSTAADEAVYHESLIFPGYTLAPRVERVLVLGGANGGVLHRVCAMPDLAAVLQVDVDRELYEVTQEVLPHMHRRAQRDPRCRVDFGQPRAVVADLTGPFDLVLADLPDAIDGSVARSLFTVEFYREVRRLLGERGVFATQAGAANDLDPEFFASVVRTLRSVFRHVVPYTVSVPSYGIPWGFAIASDTLDPARVADEQVDAAMRRLAGEAEAYDGLTHRHMFALPRRLRAALASRGRVISDHQPLTVRFDVTFRHQT
jgi:spermidine synthase